MISKIAQKNYFNYLTQINNWKNTDPKRFYQLDNVGKRLKRNNNLKVEFPIDKVGRDIFETDSQWFNKFKELNGKYIEVVSENESSSFFKTNKINKVKSCYIENNLLKICEEIHKYWSNIFRSNNIKMVDLNVYRKWETIQFKPKFKVSDIKAVLKKCKNSSSPGSDGVSYGIIKLLNYQTLKQMKQLFKSCWKIKSIPKEWKTIYITMINKCKSTPTVNDFRPISCLNTLVKIFTLVLKEGLILGLNRISKLQFGFLPNKSIEGALYTLKLVHNDANVNNKPLYMLHLDFFKAYDSVEVNVLINILNKYGFDKEYTDMLLGIYDKSYGYVKMNNKIFNKEIIINKGVRQGDVLSPMLYLFFINPLLEELESLGLGYKINNVIIPCVAYCDDIVLMANSVSVFKKLCKVVERFCIKVNILINILKSMVISNRKIEKLKMKNIFKQKESVPWLGEDKFHRILGNWVNGTLWGDNMDKEMFLVGKRLEKLNKVPLNIQNKIQIINQKIIPSILFKLNFKDSIQQDCFKINNLFGKFIEKHLKIISKGKKMLNSNSKLFDRLSRERKFGGFNLFDITNLVNANNVVIVKKYGLESNINGISKISYDLLKRKEGVFFDRCFNSLLLSKVSLIKHKISHSIFLPFSAPMDTFLLDSVGVKWTPIWTDGSFLKKVNKASSGYFINNREYASWITKGMNNSFQGELEAIEQATKCISQYNIVLFTDCKTFYDIWKSKLQWNKKSVYNGIFERIKLNIIEIKNKSKLKVCWVPSHLNTKKKKPKWCKVISKIKYDIEKKFPNSWDTVISGNNSIDEIVKYLYDKNDKEILENKEVQVNESRFGFP